MYKLLLTQEWVWHCRTPGKSSPERPYCTAERGKTGAGSAKTQHPLRPFSDRHRFISGRNFAFHSSRLNILGRHWRFFSSFMAYVSEGTTSSHNRFSRVVGRIEGLVVWVAWVFLRWREEEQETRRKGCKLTTAKTTELVISLGARSWKNYVVLTFKWTGMFSRKRSKGLLRSSPTFNLLPLPPP